MRTIKRKFISSLTLVSLVIQSCAFWIPGAYAAGNITIDAIENGGTTIPSTIALDPDPASPLNGIALHVAVQSAGEALKNAKISMDFGNNAGFSYDGAHLAGKVNYDFTTYNPYDTSIYSASSGLSATVTDSNNPTIMDEGYFEIIPIGGLKNIFLNQNISTYSNTVTVSASADTAAWDVWVSAPTRTFTIYANVKPHVIDAHFEKADGSVTTTKVQGASTEAINFVVQVKDSNGSANIAGGSVIADLSALGLSSAESLSYVSSSGLVATFKKTGIVTSASIGTKTIPVNSIIATDSDGNTNQNDSYFSSENMTSSATIEIIAPASPNTNITSVSDTKIGGILEPSSSITFTADQNGETKVVIGGDGTCSSGGTTVEDWTGSGSYTANTPKTVTILASALSDGANTINICTRSVAQIVGPTNTIITKSSVLPIISGFSFSPSSVTSNDVSATFTCNQSGSGRVELGGTAYGNGVMVNEQALLAATPKTILIANSFLLNGSNQLKVYCRDDYGNVTTGNSFSIQKTPPTPAMTGVVSLVDSDIDIDGLNGKDVFVTWGTGAVAGFESYFNSYNIYLLPAGTTFNASTQTAVNMVASISSGSAIGSTSLTKDSLGATLTSGAPYIACVAIMGTSGILGTQVCSSAAILTADIVSHPSILSARFTSDTNLEITTDATLDTVLSTHSGGLFTYTIGGTPHYPTAVTSINAKKINLTIPALGNTAAVGILTTAGTGAIHAAGGGYNNASASSINITDAQSPTISAFSKSTAATYGVFYKGSVVLNYTFNEAMSIDGSTRIEILRTSGNADNTAHRIDFTTAGETSVGSHNRTLNLDSLNLVSGTTYQIRLSGADNAGNSATAQTISSIGYDTVGPVAPVLTNTAIFGTLSPTLAWAAALDNFGNGSGIKSYSLRVYSGNACTPWAVQSYPNIPSGALSFALQAALPIDKSDYSWTLQATDNLDNTGSISLCGAFFVDTTVPVISGISLKDTVLNSSSWAKVGDSASLSATIPNSDSAHIWADLSPLTGNSGDSHVACGAPTAGVSCTYNSNVLTYIFTVGSATQNVSRIITLSAQNSAGLNDTSATASITVDSTAPSITANTITSPNGGEIWGGSSRTITWNTSHVTDAGGIANITLAYSADGGGNWTPIATVPNTGSYAWNISALSSGSSYLIRITATDNAGNTAFDQSNAVFAIDLSKPLVGSNTITSPNGSEVWKWSAARTITWNPALVTDAISLAVNPIKLEYSSDNGGSWTTIVAATANNGSYAWTTPSGNISTAKIRLTATDTAGNSETDVSDSVFAIDSTNPALSVTYADGGGSTPQNGRKINSTGIEISAGATDSYLQTISYIFRNATDSTSYIDGSGWMGGNVSNILCSDSTTFGTSNTCANPAAVHITPSIENGKTYELLISATDEAGNVTNSATHSYVGDTVAPTLAASSNTIGGYFSGALQITGTATDAGSSVGSVTIKIQKGGQYWDGANWSASATDLLVNTSDSYGHFNYSFTPPIADADESGYSIVVTASDRAYKTPNSSTSNLSVILDKNGPTIASDVFTFATTPVRKGGQNMTVSWNPAKVTTSGAPLVASPITLLYNLTGSIVTIASGLPNNGSYSFALPIADTNAGHIIIGAVDTLGNTATNIASSAFWVDSIPPSITSVESADFDANGAIDGLIITTSENTNTTGINLSDFTVSNGITLASSNAYDMASVTKIELHFSANYGNTASLPTLSYAGNSITDIAGNALVAFSGKSSIDAASPRLLSASILDGNTNGKVDTIQASFSEPLSATSDISAWTIVNPLSGVSIASVSIAGSIASLHLNEPTSPNTSTGGMMLNFTATSVYHDAGSNMAGSLGSPIALIDAALPRVINANTKDTNGNGKMDSISVKFSENILGSDAGWVISGLAAGASYAGGGTTSGDTLTLPLYETSLPSDSGTIPSLSYTPGNIQDASGNMLVSVASHAAVDTIAPVILSRTTADTDGDGKIDRIILHTSETLSGSTASTLVTVSGHSVSALSLSGSDIVATISQWANADTADTPSVQLVSAGSIEDVSANALTTEVSPNTSIDTAGPVVTMARYDFGASGGVSDDVIYATFSEPINASTLIASDFLVHAGGSLGSATLANITTTSAEIHLASDSTALTPGISSISLATTGITDALGNASPTESAANRVIVLPPVIINEVMWSSYSASASQYIELHNLGSSAIDISGWKIRNAGGNGVDITLPGGASIAGGGYYLVAKNTPGSGGSVLAGTVSPDFVSASLALSPAQNSLTLENAGAVVFDQVQANPWSAGSGSLVISMERNTIAGNGLSDANWHFAVVNRSAFSLVGAFGTPRAANEVDITAPVLSTSAVQNTLSPNTTNDIVYSVSDDYGITWPSFTATLERWNGSAWVATGTLTASTGSVTTLHTVVPTYGKYRTTMNVDDTSANASEAQYIFYVDAPSIVFNTGSIAIGSLSTTSTVTSTPLTITIHTVGAGTSVSSLGDIAMALSGGTIESIGAWNGNLGYGIDYSVTTPTGSGNIITSGVPKAVWASIFSDTTIAPDSDGNLQTYTIQLHYMGKIDEVTAAGLYKAISALKFDFNY